MSDTLDNIYPVPVEFVDGQQPTAAFLNAWAEQIDQAFALLSGVLGDFDGSGESPDTFIPNIIRAIGNTGLLTNRLPQGLRIATGGGPGSDLPFIEESLAAWEGKKEALLTFTPAVSELTDADITIANLGTAEDKGSPTVTSPLTSLSDKAILDGRRILTNFEIPANAYVVYPIDTSADDFSERMGAGTGPNIVPSIFEVLGSDPSVTTMVTISQPGGYAANEYKLTLPRVNRVMNPLTYSSFEAADQLYLDSVVSPVKWNTSGARTYPLYAIPGWIQDLAGSIIPRGLCSLWYRSGGTISRVRDVFSNEDIGWEVLTPNTLKITVPATLDLPALPATPGQSWYIVGFAGTSVAEAVIHERAFAIRHKHDGRDGSQVSAEHLVDRFEPSGGLCHSGIAFNHFPQYLERYGYQSDARNGSNVMLGDFVIGSTLGGASPILANSLATDSYKLKFSHGLTGPSVWHNASDTAGFDENPLRKIVVDVGLRVSGEALWIGAIGSDFNAVLVNNPIVDADTTRLSLLGENQSTETVMEAGMFYALFGQIKFGEDGYLEGSEINWTEDEDDVEYPYTWTFYDSDGAATKTKIIVGKLEVGDIVADTIVADSIGYGGSIFVGVSSTVETSVAEDYFTTKAGDITKKIPMGQWILQRGYAETNLDMNGFLNPFGSISSAASSLDDDGDLPTVELIFPRSTGAIGSNQEMVVIADIESNPLGFIKPAEGLELGIKTISINIGVSRTGANSAPSAFDYAIRLIRQTLVSGASPELVIVDSVYDTGSIAQSVNIYGDTIIELDMAAPIITTISTLEQTSYKYSIVFGLRDDTHPQSEVYYLKDISVKYQIVEV